MSTKVNMLASLYFTKVFLYNDIVSAACSCIDLELSDRCFEHLLLNDIQISSHDHGDNNHQGLYIAFDKVYMSCYTILSLITKSLHESHEATRSAESSND